MHGDKRREALIAMQVRNQQLKVLSKQEEVFRVLRMEEDYNAELMSLTGNQRPKARLRSSSGVRGPVNRQLLQSEKQGARNLKAGTGNPALEQEKEIQGELTN
jgi:hypothetical protein